MVLPRSALHAALCCSLALRRLPACSLHTSTTLLAGPRKPKTKPPRPQSKLQPFQSALSAGPLSKTTLVGAEDVVLLRPPPDYPIGQPLRRLAQALEVRDLSRAVEAWSDLVDLGAISRLGGGDFKGVSDFLLAVMSRKDFGNMAELAAKKPDQYGLLLSMAVESAGRDYFRPLYDIMLRLLETGRPTDVVNAFARTKSIMRFVQGKDERLVHSWDRTERLGARLNGVGLKSLMMANVAALTLLDQFDGSALYGMLDTNVSVRPNSRFDFSAIQHSLSRIPRPGPDLYSTFRNNVEKFSLAVQCYHPTALVRRITMLDHSKSVNGLDALYSRILEASIGPRAFVRPRDLEHDAAHMHTMSYIHLPSVVWESFIQAFQRRMDVPRITAMINTHLPDRGLPPNSNFLSYAMLSLSMISANSRATRTIQQDARKWAEEYWRQICDKGWHVEDRVLARRIKMLYILPREDHKSSGEAEELYAAARQGHFGRIGPRTRAAFVQKFTRKCDFKSALTVFDAFPKHTADKHGYEDAVHEFIRSLAMQKQWSNRTPLNYRHQILQLAQRTNTVIEGRTLGPLLSLQINAGMPLEPTVDTILDHSHSGHTIPGIYQWNVVINGLLTKWYPHCTPNEIELKAAIYILRRASSEELYGRKIESEAELWISFLRPLAGSSLKSSTRLELISAAYDLFPGGISRIPVTPQFEVIHLLLTRSDGKGFAEGWSRWEELTDRKNIDESWWAKMLSLLLSVKPSFAQILVRTAWEYGKVGIEEPFWRIAHSTGVLAQLGILHAYQDRVNQLNIEKGSRETLLTKAWGDHIWFEQEGEEDGKELLDGACADPEIDYPSDG